MTLADYKAFYDAVYSQDHPCGESHGWIQWKGTDVCMDIHCACGHSGHVDGDFFYYYRCPSCQRVYAVGQNVKLIPLTAEQVQFLADSGSTIDTDTNGGGGSAG